MYLDLSDLTVNTGRRWVFSIEGTETMNKFARVHRYNIRRAGLY